MTPVDLRGVLHDERGVVLPLVLLALVVLASLTASLLMSGSTDVVVAANLLRGIQAEYVAEAGLQDAFNVFRATPSLVFGAPSSLTTVPGLTGPGTTVAGIGSYTVTYQTVGSSTVRVVSTGTVTGGAQAVVRATFSNVFGTSNAVLAQGNLSMSGNATVNGSCGNVHANGNISLSGNPSVTGANGVSASGTLTTSGNPNVPGGTHGSTATQAVPDISPATFLTAAQASLPANQIFQMKANGQVLDGNGNVLTTLTSGGTFQNWRYTAGSPASFSLSGNTATNGLYYMEGNVSVSGNPGSAQSPWNTTLLATGNITLSGNASILDLLTDTLAVAGGSVTISGNPTTGFNGLIAADNAVSLSGNATINGFIIAHNETTLSDTISGNPTITYNCGLNPPLFGSLNILTWGR